MFRFKIKLLDTELDQLLVSFFFREYSYEFFGGVVDLICFGFTVLITMSLTEGHITVSEGIKRELAYTVHMSEAISKVDPFLTAITARLAVKQCVYARICHIQQ